MIYQYRKIIYVEWNGQAWSRDININFSFEMKMTVLSSNAGQITVRVGCKFKYLHVYISGNVCYGNHFHLFRLD